MSPQLWWYVARAGGLVAYGLLVPLAAAWRPWAVAWGVVAVYLLVAVQATSLARRRLPHRLWRRVHLAAFPLLLAATAHLLTAGSDRTNPAVLAMITVTAAATIFLLLFRLLRLARPSQTTATRSRPPASMRPRRTHDQPQQPQPEATKRPS